jgi:hypothetical protein
LPPAIAAAAAELYTSDSLRTSAGRPSNFRPMSVQLSSVQLPSDVCPTFVQLSSIELLSDVRPVSLLTSSSCVPADVIVLPSYVMHTSLLMSLIASSYCRHVPCCPAPCRPTVLTSCALRVVVLSPDVLRNTILQSCVLRIVVVHLVVLCPVAYLTTFCRSIVL